FDEESCAGRAVIGSDETHLHPLGVVMPAKNDHLRPSAGNFSDDVGHLEFALSVHIKTPPKLIRQSNASIPRIKVIPKRRDLKLDQGLFLSGFATRPFRGLLNI